MRWSYCVDDEAETLICCEPEVADMSAGSFRMHMVESELGELPVPPT